jgi:outer membrane protein TolC
MNWNLDQEQTLELSIANSNQLMSHRYLQESYISKAKEYANEYLPTLGISLIGEVENIKGYPSYSQSYQPNYRSWTKDFTGMIILEWDLFDGGRNWQTSNSYKAKAAQEKEVFKDFYDQLISDTMTSFLNINDLNTEIMVNVMTVKNGVQLLKMDRAALLYGVGDVTTIAQDQSNIVSETQTLLNNLSAYNKSIIDLVIKTGISIDSIKYGSEISPISILEQLNFKLH